MNKVPQLTPSPERDLTLIDRFSKIILIFALGGVLTLAGFFFFIAQPSADDWLRGAPVSKLYLAQVQQTAEATTTAASGFAFLKSQYFEWTGRWAGIGLAIFSMAAVDPSQSYWLLLILLAGVNLVGVHMFIRSLLKAHLSKKDTRIATIFFVVLYWSSVPSPGEVIYWLTGGIENLLSISLSLLLLAILLAPKKDDAGKWGGLLRAGRYLGAALLACLATGMHELFGLLLCITLTTGTAIAFRVRHHERWLWLATLLVAIAALLFVVVAPGNYLRAQTIHTGRNLTATLLTGSKHLIKSVVSWSLDPKLICASLLFALHPKIRLLRPAWLSWTNIPWRGVLPVIWIGMGLIPFYAVVWLKGRTMDDRTLSGTYLIFLLGWFANLFVMTRSNQPRADAPAGRLLQLFVYRALPIAFACSLIFTGNMRTAISDIREKRPMAWYHAKRDRDRQIRLAASRGETSLAVVPLPECPHIFCENDFLNSPNTYLRWRNESLAKFYGLKLIWQEPILQH